MQILFRRFSKLQEFLVVKGKASLPALNLSDSERNVKDLSAFFDYMLETAPPNPINPEHPIISKSVLNKIIVLSKSTTDIDLAFKAYWTFYGHKLWPSLATVELLIQACINLDVPEKAADIVEVSEWIVKDEKSYLMALVACKQEKKWRQSNRFFRAGKSKNMFSQEFYDALSDLRSELSEEDSKHFIYDL